MSHQWREAVLIRVACDLDETGGLEALDSSWLALSWRIDRGLGPDVASFAGIRRISGMICYRTGPQRTMSMEVAAPFEALYTATKARFIVSLMPSSST